MAIVGLLATPVMAADYEFTVVPDEETGVVKADNVIITKKEIRAAYAGSLAQIKERYLAAKEQRNIAIAAMQREVALYLELKAEIASLRRILYVGVGICLGMGILDISQLVI